MWKSVEYPESPAKHRQLLPLLGELRAEELHRGRVREGRVDELRPVRDRRDRRRVVGRGRLDRAAVDRDALGLQPLLDRVRERLAVGALVVEDRDLLRLQRLRHVVDRRLRLHGVGRRDAEEAALFPFVSVELVAVGAR